MKPRWLVLFLLVFLLSACLSTPTPFPTPTPAEPTAPPAILPTFAPTTTQPPSAVPPTLQPTTAPNSTLTPSPAPQPTTAPTARPSLTPTTQSVSDCARFPNFGSCGINLALTGRLAIFDPQRQMIQMLDFPNKTLTEIKSPADAHSFQWTDQGNTLVSLNRENQPALVWRNPVLSSLPLLPVRSTQGAPVFSNTSGTTAWMVQQENGQFFIHIRLPSTGQEHIWPVEPQAGDRLHLLLGWVPGTNLLLGGSYYAGNSMWITGSSLYTLDASTGGIRDLKASLRLSGSFQWHPTQPGLLLFGNSNSPVVGAPRPSVLDVVSGKLTTLFTDETVSSNSLGWVNGGKSILVGIKQVNPTPNPNSQFSAAIYQVDWPTGTSKALTKPAATNQDDWPQMLSDEKRFLYVRILADGKTAELRLGALDGSLDAQVVTGLPVNPSAGLTGFQWETLLSYAP